MQCGIAFIAMSVVVLFHSLLNNIYLHLYQHLLMQLLSGILICLPETPVREFFISSIGKVSFLSCYIPLLAFAGLSVGGQLEELKKMSWKVILIFMIVSTCCFFGASIVAQNWIYYPGELSNE